MKAKQVDLRLFVLTVFVGMVSSVHLFAQERFERWQDEVHWIASKAEKETFKSARTEEEQISLMNRFWQRRDPTPRTERNEYKEEHYRRWEYVKENFREGIPAWRSDRGRVYLIHGAPDVEEFRDVPTSGGPGSRRSRRSIVWTYYEMPTAKYFQGRMVLVFQSNIGLTEQDFTLGESQMALSKAQQLYDRAGMRPSDYIDTAVRYRIVSAGPPTSLTGRGGDLPSSGIGEYARHLEDILRSPGELLEEADRRREELRTHLEERISSRVSYSSLPLHMVVQDFYPGDQAEVTVTWQFPLSELEFQSSGGIYEARVDLIAQVRDVQSNEPVDEFFKTLEFRHTAGELPGIQAEHFRYMNGFNLPAGNYVVSSIARDSATGKLGSASTEVSCKQLSDRKLMMSGLVLSRGVATLEDSGIGQELIIDDQWQLVPESDLEFEPNERLVLFFKLYNAVEVEGAPQMLVSYEFLRDGAVFRRSRPRPLTAFSEQEGVVSFSSILDLRDFPAGSYQLQVNAIDYHSRQYVIERKRFVVN